MTRGRASGLHKNANEASRGMIMRNTRGPSFDILVTIFALLILALIGCEDDDGKDPVDPIDYGSIQIISYDQHVQPLLNKSCAVSACHSSTDRAGGLSLGTWNEVISGSDNGEVLIPFNADESLMTDLFDTAVTKTNEHAVLTSDRALSKDALEFLKRWIQEGAKNEAGAVPFANSSNKVYVTNQLDDKISIIDVASNVVMRIVPVGTIAGAEEPHFIVSDGSYWYATLISAGEIWKFDATTDTLVQVAPVGGAPALMALTPDGQKLYVSQFMDPLVFTDVIQVMETATMAVIKTIDIMPTPVGQIPHGIRINHAGTRVFVASLAGGYITVIDTQTDSIVAEKNVGNCIPLQMTLSPDDSEIWVSCNIVETDSIRVYDAVTLSSIAQIPVGNDPWHSQFTPDGLQFVVANRGSDNIMVIDVASRTVAKTFVDPAITLPHGVDVTADGKFAYVSNGNPDGLFVPRFNPVAVGNVVVIDMETLEIVKVLELEERPTGLFVYPPF